MYVHGYRMTEGMSQIYYHPLFKEEGINSRIGYLCLHRGNGAVFKSIGSCHSNYNCLGSTRVVPSQNCIVLVFEIRALNLSKCELRFGFNSKLMHLSVGQKIFQ